ncbi:DUF4043 family protein [Pasteurellaceae bacterium 20609_3]|uniref:phage capsid family protein n=1 Tax=Spirabiliibacterium mucosae TaxID=28156 RepID=UPI001AACA463|nr:DUF4043 family protein [Spirabiliibacterium mucosae]MBE2897787.1 DUF4043 family protein [Spirabiliibacterium mucosae]
MAAGDNLTNFGKLLTNQKKVWDLDVWKQARAKMFINKFMGTGSDAMIQHLTSLTKTAAGDQVVIHLLADLIGDGVTDDYTLEGNEEAMKAYDQIVKVDQLRHAVRSKGKMADQRSVIAFRKNAKDQLAYWLADRIDQLAFLTLSGIKYEVANTGAKRVKLGHAPGTTGYLLKDLAFATDVTAPTDARWLRVKANGDFDTGDITKVAAGDKLTYKHIVNLKAYARDNYIRGVGANNDKYHMFVTPAGMAQLKLDDDFMANARHAGVRGSGNELFAGSDTLLVDGVYIHQYHHVFNTRTATAGTKPSGANKTEEGRKWGTDGNVEGQRALFCGAQALAFADVGGGSWEEETFDYGNQNGISYGRIFGMKKPVWQDKVSGKPQDFGVIAVDTAI